MFKRTTIKVWLCIVILLTLASSFTACTASSAQTDSPFPTETALPTATATAIPPEVTVPVQRGPVTINIWLPPQFDPTLDNPASKLLAARLEEFSNRRSDVIIQTRIKDIAGLGGIVDTLGSAVSAAPLALPDLVVLDHQSLSGAAAKGLLHPFDGLTDILEDPDWFEFSRQLSFAQNSIYGIPFAGDAQIMVYRPEIVETAPPDWATMLGLETALSYPAADPDSLLTMILYQASGGGLTDEEGNPQLEALPLTEVLTFLYQANTIEVIPFWLTQYETDDQAWVAYQEAQSNLAITWLSRFLKTELPDSALATIPTADSIPYTFGTGWVWSLVSTDPERQELVAELVEFLTQSEYLAEWAHAAGYLPPRPSAVLAWESEAFYPTLIQIGSSAHLMPPTEIIQILGPILSENTVDVLKEQTDPATAAQNAIEALPAP
jgi:multiple sugar transport system substrate-binding protein